ncbi:MAG: NADH-quinone oxidoreductase subunit L, partial [Vulcanimicrobiaceae bacterium]
LLPLAGALAIWAFGPYLRRAAGVLGSLCVLVPFVLALALFGPATAAGGAHPGFDLRLYAWLPGIDLGLLLDPLSLVWALVICGVGGLIHVYSIGYMWPDRAIARFFAYMNLFVFAMLTLVLSDNLIGLLVGWGLVGLASYLLIGFWFERPSAVAAARKAFVINVVGDIGIMFAIFAVYLATGTLSYAGIFAAAPTLGPGIALAICIGLLIGAAAKSAQVPLHTWLPDAMEGPTPVSALIHAATMVTAGVYLIARFAPLWSRSASAQEIVGIVGALTALWGGVLGCTQWDIKRILAYSTMSQIGYMILAVGVGAYGAGVLHFLTHAFFKAQLFLGAGIVIQALADEQDARKMGGLWRRMPFAFVALLLGTLSICGVPGFAGYFSKDAVIYGTLAHGHPILAAIGALTAALTAYYMFRMLFLMFFGPYRGDVPDSELGLERAPAAHHHGEGAPPPRWLKVVPVAILFVPTVAAGYLWLGGEASPWSRFLGTSFGVPEIVPSAPPLSEGTVSLIVLALVILGFLIAFARYARPVVQRASIARLRSESLRMPLAFRRLLFADDAINALFVVPARALGSALARVVEPHVIDAGVRDLVWLTGAFGYLTRLAQNGLVRSYALSIVVGVALFLAYFASLGAPR